MLGCSKSELVENMEAEISVTFYDPPPCTCDLPPEYVGPCPSPLPPGGGTDPDVDDEEKEGPSP